ncbi:hypothetical protein CCP3SC15_5690001 [Gammaproteobacteria bacterium]
MIRREEQAKTHPSFWSVWLPLFHKDGEARDRVGNIEGRVAQALEELRRGNWNSGIEELSNIEYAPIWHWVDAARNRLDLEQWYADLRQELWGGHPGTRIKRGSLGSLICSKTCRIPLCKPGKLCLNHVLTRFK